MKKRVRCEFPKCKRMFWSKVKGGIALENFCVKCRNKIYQEKVRQKNMEKKKSKSKETPEQSVPAPKSPPKRKSSKIKGRTPDIIRSEIRDLEYRRTNFPKIKKDAHFHNLRVVQANDVIAEALKRLYDELEVAERLGLSGHGKKKRKN